MGVGYRPSGLQMDEPALWHGEGGADQHTDAVNLYRQRKFVERATAADPGIHVARAPVVRSDRVGPAAVSAVHLGEIGAPERPVLLLLKTVAAADIHSRSRRNLHWSLRPLRVWTPHLRIGPVIGFGSLDRKRQPVERNGFPALARPDRHQLCGRGGWACLGSRAVVSCASTEDQAQG